MNENEINYKYAELREKEINQNARIVALQYAKTFTPEINGVDKLLENAETIFKYINKQ